MCRPLVLVVMFHDFTVIVVSRFRVQLHVSGPRFHAEHQEFKVGSTFLHALIQQTPRGQDVGCSETHRSVGVRIEMLLFTYCSSISICRLPVNIFQTGYFVPNSHKGPGGGSISLWFACGSLLISALRNLKPRLSHFIFIVSPTHVKLTGPLLQRQQNEGLHVASICRNTSVFSGHRPTCRAFHEVLASNLGTKWDREVSEVEQVFMVSRHLIFKCIIDSDVLDSITTAFSNCINADTIYLLHTILFPAFVSNKSTWTFFHAKASRLNCCLQIFPVELVSFILLCCRGVYRRIKSDAAESYIQVMP